MRLRGKGVVLLILGRLIEHFGTAVLSIQRGGILDGHVTA
jgi:hypothetical protein